VTEILRNEGYFVVLFVETPIVGNTLLVFIIPVIYWLHLIKISLTLVRASLEGVVQSNLD
jgi:hypothetical protein